jgi:hypothetical protein
LLATACADLLAFHKLDGNECLQLILEQKEEEYARSFAEAKLHEGTCSSSGFTQEVPGGSKDLLLPFVDKPLSFTRMRMSTWDVVKLKAEVFLSAPLIFLGAAKPQNHLRISKVAPTKFKVTGRPEFAETSEEAQQFPEKLKLRSFHKSFELGEGAEPEFDPLQELPPLPFPKVHISGAENDAPLSRGIWESRVNMFKLSGEDCQEIQVSPIHKPVIMKLDSFAEGTCAKNGFTVVSRLQYITIPGMSHPTHVFTTKRTTLGLAVPSSHAAAPVTSTMEPSLAAKVGKHLKNVFTLTIFKISGPECQEMRIRMAVREDAAENGYMEGSCNAEGYTVPIAVETMVEKTIRFLAKPREVSIFKKPFELYAAKGEKNKGGGGNSMRYQLWQIGL